MRTTLDTVTSPDGTTIAIEQTGQGHPVVLVGGAFNDRSTVAGLAATLSGDVNAITYDRRGRGGSGDHPGHTVQAEIDDLAAVIDYVGGSACVFGHSSGAVLALEAAMRGVAVGKLALYEPTYVVDDSRPHPGADLADRLRTLLALGRRDEAAGLFLVEAVSLPPELVEGMQASPIWAMFAGLAHTLPYDAELCGPGMVLPGDRLATITTPTLVMHGSRTAQWLSAAAGAVAAAIPHATHTVIDGQDHGVLQQPDALHSALVAVLD